MWAICLNTTGSAKHKNAKRAAKVVYFSKKTTVSQGLHRLTRITFFLRNHMANGLA
jgi:hypothetical protein